METRRPLLAGAEGLLQLGSFPSAGLDGQCAHREPKALVVLGAHIGCRAAAVEPEHEVGCGFARVLGVVAIHRTEKAPKACCGIHGSGPQHVGEDRGADLTLHLSGVVRRRGGFGGRDELCRSVCHRERDLERTLSELRAGPLR